MAERATRGEQWARRNGRSPYDAMDTEEIMALPVGDFADRDCTLLLWATNPKLPDAFRVMEAWSFEYKTCLTWVKMQAVGAPRSGLGYHARACTEHLLVGARGGPGVPPPAERPYGVIFCPRAGHSAKPDFQYDIAEGYPGPYLEVFARRRRAGWVSIGDHLDGLDVREALSRLAAGRALPVLPVEQGEFGFAPAPRATHPRGGTG